LAEIDTTPQRRATWWPARRSLDMNLIVKFGVAAAALAMAVVLGYGLWQNIGNQAPAPRPEASDEPSAASGALPAELRRIFIGATRDVTGIEVDDRLVIDLTAQILRLHTGIDASALVSTATVVESGALRFETVAGTTGCAEGEVGTYPYSLSPRGTVLTIAAGDEDCAARADALIGEWRASACLDPGNWCLGELEAGTQTSLFFDPYLDEFGPPVARYGALSYEVPDGWANADDRTHFYTLMRASAYERGGINCHDCPDSIFLGANPRAGRMDCSSEEPDQAVGASADALADWIRAHPGLQVDERPTITVDGRQAFVLDITATEDYADACVDAEADDVTFVPLLTHPGYSWGIRTGDRQRLILVEVGADTAMLIGIDTLDPANLDGFIEETQPIIDSVRLTEP
jgi:hypothetical protein